MPSPADTAQKVLIIEKGGNSHTWCSDLIGGFQQHGCDIRSLRLRSRTAVERIHEWKTGDRLWLNHKTVSRVAACAAEFKPDLVVLMNFSGLPKPAAVLLRKACGTTTPVIGWLADHIVNLPGWAEPNLDGVYAFDSATMTILEKAYGNTSSIGFLPLAVNPSRFPSRGKPWETRIAGLVFIGKHCPERLSMIDQLRNAGVPVSSFGPRANQDLRWWRRRRIRPSACARMYGSHQFVLNLPQAPNTVHGLNLRAYEAAASGGIGTYPPTPDLDASFVPDAEILTFKNASDLAAKTRALRFEPDLAEQMIAAAKKRCLSHHTYFHRASRMLNDWLR